MNLSRLQFNLERANKKPHFVVDIGAHQGEFFKRYTKDYPGYVFMIEANPKHQSILEMLLKEKYPDVDPSSLHRMTLLGKEASPSVPFYTLRDGNDTGSSIYLENTKYYKDYVAQFMSMMTLDELDPRSPDGYERIDLLKMDVQGAELDIIKGATKTLERTDLILMEVSFQPYNIGAPLLFEILEYMNKIGFIAIDIFDNNYYNNIHVQSDILFARKNSPYICTTFK
jgi:FkbM family methyltransferase